MLLLKKLRELRELREPCSLHSTIHVRARHSIHTTDYMVGCPIKAWYTRPLRAKTGGFLEIAEAGKRVVSELCGATRTADLKCPGMQGMYCIMRARCPRGAILLWDSSQFCGICPRRYRRRGRGKKKQAAAAAACEGGWLLGWNSSGRGKTLSDKLNATSSYTVHNQDSLFLFVRTNNLLHANPRHNRKNRSKYISPLLSLPYERLAAGVAHEKTHIIVPRPISPAGPVSLCCLAVAVRRLLWPHQPPPPVSRFEAGV